MADNVQGAIAALRTMADLNPLVREPLEISTVNEGPLAGVPVVVKSNIAVEGLPHCGASAALSDNIASSSAPVVARLLNAGAVIVGQANMHELAFGITSHNASYGPVGNPANAAHMAGGSSGGTAAAVAGGAVPMGLASDTGGSGRLPAAMCGCVGFRPTHGRYPAEGVLTLSTSFDTVTPMARDVSGVTVLDAVLAGTPRSLAPMPRRLRLGIVEDALWQGVDAAMSEMCRQKLEHLVAAGVELVPLSCADLVDRCAEISMGIVLYETSVFWKDFLAQRGTTLAQFADQITSTDVSEIFDMIADGAAPTTQEYNQMVGPKRQAIVETMASLLTDVDGLIMPTLATVAPPIQDIQTCRINGQEVDLFTAMTARALVASVSMHPSVSLPAGRLGGLPIGLEVIGKHQRDEELLAMAAWIETHLQAAA